jgi:hypothetical protein
MHLVLVGSLAAGVAGPARGVDGPWLAQTLQRPRRQALVIGNGAYAEAPLANPENDANDVAKALREIGFEVTLLTNTNLRQIEETVEAFSRQLGPGAIGVFYYAGHGVQVAGENYLIPLDKRLEREADVRYEAMPLGRVLNALNDSPAVAKILIIDACRDNPFLRRWRSNRRSLASRGLAAPQSSGQQNTLIAFATSPDTTAADSAGSRNSPYTTQLLRYLRTPNLDVIKMFQLVRRGVRKLTDDRQIPQDYSSLEADVILNQQVVAATAVSPTPPVVPPMAQSQPQTVSPQPRPSVQPSATPSPTPFAVDSSLANLVRDNLASPTAPEAPQTANQPAAPSGQPIGSPFQGHGSYVNSVAFSHDGLRIVSGSSDKTLRVWDAQSGRPIGPPLKGHTRDVNSVAFSPDSRRVASGAGAFSLFGFGSSDNTVRVWDASSGQQIGLPLKGHTRAVNAVAFSPDGRRIVSGSWDKTLRVWDAESGQPIGPPLQGHTSAVRSVRYSPDGRLIVSGSDDATVRIWDASTGKQIGSPLTGHTYWVRSVAFSPDGRRIVSGSFDQTLRVWDVSSGLQIGPPLQGHSSVVWSVAFSPDSHRIISGSGEYPSEGSNSTDNTVRVWDANSGKPIGPALVGHTYPVLSVAYSPDGRRIVSGSADNTLRVWDADGGQPIRP